MPVFTGAITYHPLFLLLLWLVCLWALFKLAQWEMQDDIHARAAMASCLFVGVTVALIPYYMRDPCSYDRIGWGTYILWWCWW